MSITMEDEKLYVVKRRIDWTTEQRVGYLKDRLPDLDNYAFEPGQDPDFDSGWVIWHLLFKMATGVERAAAIQVAAELWRQSVSFYRREQAPFFSCGVLEEERDRLYAKAMCLMYRNLLEER